MTLHPDAAALSNVSRETQDRLLEYSDMLLKWNRSINLVSSKTIDSFWTRHILDSAQLHSLLPDHLETATDLGTGGGFPGLVLSILCCDTHPDLHYSFIESDKRKAAFLQTVIGKLALNARAISERIELAEPQQAEVVTARALAPLPKLLPYVFRHQKEGGTALLLKGKSVDAELEEALASWSLELKRYSSKTTPDGTVLRISKLRPSP